MNQDHTISTSPITGEVIGQSRMDSVDQLQAKIVEARAVQAEWAHTSLKHRRKAILRVRDYVVTHAEELAATVSVDNGKTRLDAMASEVVPAATAANYYAAHASEFLRARRLAGGSLLSLNKASWIRRVPWGVIGIISPWNYPLSIPFSEVVMGLLAGNVVVLKVASETQMVGRSLEAAFAAAGLPQGVFSYVNLPGRIAGNALLEAGIDKLFFTGSVAVGQRLMAKAAETLTPVCLELGGNDAMLVCPDADLERAVAGALWAGLSNCGQSCGGVERIYVHAKVYRPFVEELAAKVRALRVGPDSDHSDHDVDLGAMTTRRQLETVRQQVREALDAGATLFAQSACRADTSGNFLPAMVLTDVDHSMRVMREETFGPVLAVMRVADMNEAIRLANDSHLGLTGSVWSRSRRTARKLAEQIQAGVVTLNDHLMSHGLPETPWGGFKQSGIGRTHGRIGFDEMTQPQCVVDDWLPGMKRNLWWYPYRAEVYQCLVSFLDVLYAKRLARRMKGVIPLVKTLRRVFRKPSQ